MFYVIRENWYTTEDYQQRNKAMSTSKNIDDLISAAQATGSRLQISSEEVEGKLQEKMEELEQKKKEEITRLQAEGSGLGYISLKGFPVAPEALSLISESEARRLEVVCFFSTDRELRLGAVHPESPEVFSLLKHLEEEHQKSGGLYQISAGSLAAALKLYATLPHPKKFDDGIEISAADLDKYQAEIKSFRDLHEQIQHVSTTDLLTTVTAVALKSDASDIHIEAEQDDIKIRFRIDGFLHDVAVLSKKLWPKVISRVKLLARLKLNITDIPQDGRFTIYLKDEFIDVRVSTVPTTYGESVVMRLLMSSATGFDLEDLGLVGQTYEILKEQIDRPNGMILNTGPTGSGKTTTLYAILKKLNKPELKIITLENPIEYRLKGVIQSQVETSDTTVVEDASSAASHGKKRHYTYAVALKSVLRQDPDVVMVGEIRDKETTEIAIQAALTGHLLLSTLHTNTASGAVPRLISMEAKPFLLAPSLNIVIGQRLVRRICPHCKEQYVPPTNVLIKAQHIYESLPADKKRQGVSPEAIVLYHGKGCDKCSQIGYKGRIGIFELLAMSEDIQQSIMASQISESQIEAIGKKHGMITMVQDGILKALEGMTTPEEVFRVID